MNRDTGESPGENRGPLLLYFLCLHPPDRPASPTARFIFSRQGEFRAYGRGSLLAAATRCTDSLCASGGPISFSSERNGGKERRQKPMVFGIPFVRSQPRRKRAHAESLLPLSPLPLPRAAGKCRILPPWNSVPPRGTRRRFSAYPSRAGSLEICGFKQRFWSLLGLRPKVTHAQKCGVLPSKKRMSGPSRTTPIPTKNISPSKKRNPAPLGAGSL